MFIDGEIIQDYERVIKDYPTTRSDEELIHFEFIEKLRSGSKGWCGCDALSLLFDQLCFE